MLRSLRNAPNMCTVQSWLAMLCKLVRWLFKLHIATPEIPEEGTLAWLTSLVTAHYIWNTWPCGFIRIQPGSIPGSPIFFGDPPADPLGTQCSMCRLFRRGRLEDQPAGNLCDRSKVIKLGKTTGNHRKPSKSP